MISPIEKIKSIAMICLLTFPIMKSAYADESKISCSNILSSNVLLEKNNISEKALNLENKLFQVFDYKMTVIDQQPALIIKYRITTCYFDTLYPMPLNNVALTAIVDLDKKNTAPTVQQIFIDKNIGEAIIQFNSDDFEELNTRNFEFNFSGDYETINSQNNSVIANWKQSYSISKKAASSDDETYEVKVLPSEVVKPVQDSKKPTTPVTKPPLMSNQIDLLFVVDFSTEMSKYLKQFGEQLPNIVKELNSMGIDYRIAVTTVNSNGKLVSNPKVLTSTTLNAGDILSNLFTSGASSSDMFKQGLDSMVLVFSPKATDSRNDFFRKDAKLNIITISGRDDFSKYTLSSYKSFLDKLKPISQNSSNSWVFNYLGTSVLNRSCGEFPTTGKRYLELAKYSNGLIESICQPNWEEISSSLTSGLNNMMTNYYFPKKPNKKSIIVTVNGNTIPENDVDGWSYVEGNNSAGTNIFYVKFNGTLKPDAFSKIEVKYDASDI
jgi:hypothetical protein